MPFLRKERRYAILLTIMIRLYLSPIIIFLNKLLKISTSRNIAKLWSLRSIPTIKDPNPWKIRNLWWLGGGVRSAHGHLFFPIFYTNHMVKHAQLKSPNIKFQNRHQQIKKEEGKW